VGHADKGRGREPAVNLSCFQGPMKTRGDVSCPPFRPLDRLVGRGPRKEFPSNRPRRTFLYQGR
jgi:hypothetical protein